MLAGMLPEGGVKISSWWWRVVDGKEGASLAPALLTRTNPTASFISLLWACFEEDMTYKLKELEGGQSPPRFSSFERADLPSSSIQISSPSKASVRNSLLDYPACSD